MSSYFNSSKKHWLLIGVLSLLLVGGGIGLILVGQGAFDQSSFDGERALADVAAQTGFGPRTPGSEAHTLMLEWLLAELQEAGWQAEIQEGEMLGHPIRNVVARRGDAPAQVILGAHYDSRLVADQDTDPQMRQQAVTGANDGASGVAVLLELARVLPEEAAQTTWLVFFDAEDQGNISGWDWILGSRLFAESLEQLPEAVVIVDMVGDANLQLPREGNSDEAVASEIWAAAAELGYVDIFRDEIKYHMLDDHIPFIERGIPAVDIIDFDYPYWHTAEDTLDKVSAESLQVVGDTLLSWLTP
jgi:hypothetical protein